MGRRVKYSTKAERKEAQKRWSREYYYRNRAVLQAKARERYREKKRKEFYDKKVQDLYGNLG